MKKSVNSFLVIFLFSLAVILVPAYKAHASLIADLETCVESCSGGGQAPVADPTRTPTGCLEEGWLPGGSYDSISGEYRADDYWGCQSFDYSTHFSMSLNLNKNSPYNPGDVVTLSVTAQYLNATTEVKTADITALVVGFPATSKTLFFGNTSANRGSLTGSGVFTLPVTPGSYNLNVKSTYYNNGVNLNYNIPFVIKAPAVKTVDIVVKKSDSTVIPQNTSRQTTQGVRSGDVVQISYTPINVNLPYTCTEPPSVDYPSNTVNNGKTKPFTTTPRPEQTIFYVSPKANTTYSVNCAEGAPRPSGEYLYTGTQNGVDIVYTPIAGIHNYQIAIYYNDSGGAHVTAYDNTPIETDSTGKIINASSTKLCKALVDDYTHLSTGTYDCQNNGVLSSLLPLNVPSDGVDLIISKTFSGGVFNTTYASNTSYQHQP